jgi:type II restriction enzyme
LFIAAIRDLIPRVDLRLPTDRLGDYKSGSQRARVSTEPWGEANLYCPACDSPKINALPTGTHASDFNCPACASRYQLKSSASRFGRRVIDGAFAAMQRAILSDQTPNMFFLHYNRSQLTVQSVLLVPHFAFSMSCVEKRKALSPTARRHDYVGCYFLLDRIPTDARIPIVQNGRPVSSAEVRRAYGKIRRLESLGIEKRGWTLDVLNVVRSLRKAEFLLSDVYGHADSLAKLHPQNRHVRDKIRQQLQVLRDHGFLKFLDRGTYRLS